MKLLICDIKTCNRLRSIDQEKVRELAESIKLIGLLQPVLVDQKNVLIAGHHRLEACKLLGWTEIEAVVADFDELTAKLAEIDENLRRNELTVLQQAQHLQQREQVLEQMGLRAKVGWNGNQHTEKVGGETISPPKTTDDIAQEVGLTGRSVQHRKQIANKITPGVQEVIAETAIADSTTQLLDLARMDPEQQQQVVEEMKSSGEWDVRKAKSKLNRDARIEKIAEIAIGNTNLSAIAGSPSAPNQFPVIYADPPWRYEHVKTDNRAIENQYPTMALEEICALPVADLATPDAILFLWTTSPKLDESLDVVDAWGFTYRTCAVWDKEKIGMGYYFRQQHELLLVATRGSIPVPPVESRVSSVLRYPRGEHSAKPLEVARIIEAMYPELPKVELFCRNPQPGWFAWGNQAYEAAA